MNRFSNLLIKSIGALTLTGLAACDYIHDDSIAPCEYRLRLVYDYNMKFADASNARWIKPHCLSATTRVILSGGKISRERS